jgi:hypothetical protein
VIFTPPNFYAEWRQRGALAPRLHEESAIPPERLLQLVWFHQRLLREQLITLDGRQVKVLHPGFWSYEGGPDFRSAVIQLDGEPARSMDVEVDLHSHGWHAHGHDRNPTFNKVALHVVWEGDDRTKLPTLPLKSVLDSPLNELVLWLGSAGARKFPEELLGQCCAPLGELSSSRLNELLHQAALVRFTGKASQCEARARQAGWEQALWEGVLRGLGYKHNVWPMQRLAELRERISPPKADHSPFALQARLLGIGGLLPHDVTPQQASRDPYLRRLWDFWWRERATFDDCVMPRTLWHFHALRPANHPQRRLGLAAHWLAEGNLSARLEKWGLGNPEPNSLASSLLSLLQTTTDEYWSWHWTLRSKRLPAEQPLLGAARVTDLAVNVILPWLWARAAHDHKESARSEIERRYFAWPRAEDNALLRLARQRLLGSARPSSLPGAAAQQGLLQVLRDFCEHAGALCANCQFPELVRRWGA